MYCIPQNPVLPDEAILGVATASNPAIFFMGDSVLQRKPISGKMEQDLARYNSHRFGGIGMNRRLPLPPGFQLPLARPNLHGGIIISTVQRRCRVAHAREVRPHHAALM
ncbi:hypothetical protein B0T18DRAFT_238272 [Schizothecium vesticola]|uniref:Uncharacterized protein n=1 Tax=Schizothecium vesticola TaxID=314040 RepID=A0AA40BPL4_9PEZI|nr:hypothetical protein B0T18DRAFT_238272 [Schizothecium vesticola]